MNFFVSSKALNGSNPPCLRSTFKELSKNTSHAQIRVKMKKLWFQQVGEEKQATEHKLCRDKARKFVTTNLDYVATKLEDKICREKVLLCRNKTKDNSKTNFFAIKV